MGSPIASVARIRPLRVTALVVTVVVLGPEIRQTARRLRRPPFSFQFRRCTASSLEVQNLATDRAQAGGTFRSFIASGWVDQNQAMAARIVRSREAILVLHDEV